jgi:phage tail sheath protein FI
MGGRTFNNTTGERYINVRRTMIFLKKELTDRSNFAVFENNDARLWNQIRSSLGNFLRSVWAQQGLRGATAAEAFYVKCDSSNNSATDILNGKVNIEIGVALEYPAEFIVISIGQITGSATA